MKHINFGGLAAAALAGVLAVSYGILNSGHASPQALGAGVLIGAAAGTAAFFVPPRKPDGTLSPVYQYGRDIAGHIPGQAGQIAQSVLDVAASLPNATGRVTESTTSSATVSPSAPTGTPTPTPSNGAVAMPAAEPAPIVPVTPAQNAALESLLAQAAELGIAHLLPGAAVKAQG